MLTGSGQHVFFFVDPVRIEDGKVGGIAAVLKSIALQSDSDGGVGVCVEIVGLGPSSNRPSGIVKTG